MPYQAHSAFIEPADRNARLWRYMDLPRLLSVLDNGALFFPSVATFAENDPYEGEPALAKIRAARARGADEIRRLQLQCDVFKHLNFFNCWHMNDGESDAMWKIYVRGSEGVAIQSTVGRLIASFNEQSSQSTPPRARDLTKSPVRRPSHDRQGAARNSLIRNLFGASETGARTARTPARADRSEPIWEC